MLSCIMNSSDLDRQLFDYLTKNGNTMYDEEYDVLRTVERMVMGKKN